MRSTSPGRPDESWLTKSKRYAQISRFAWGTTDVATASPNRERLITLSTKALSEARVQDVKTPSESLE